MKETRIRDRAYYELAEEGTDHYHLVCDQCGSTLHIEGDHMVPVLHHITDEHEFVVSNADLVVHGRCARCQAKAAGPGWPLNGEDRSRWLSPSRRVTRCLCKTPMPTEAGLAGHFAT